MKIPFVGPSYVYPTVNFDSQRSINLYPAKSEVGTSKSFALMSPTPGRILFATIPTQAIRGTYTSDNRAFVLAFNTFYEVLSDGTVSTLGTITSFSGNVSISDNGLQVMIVDGSTDGWIFTLATDNFAIIADADFEGGVTVTFNGSYFLVNRPNSSIYQISAPFNGTDWDATEFANAEGSPDELVAVATTHQQTFLLGSNSTEIVSVTEAKFPFQKIQGVFIEYGCSAAFTVQEVANTIFWVGSDKAGANVVWQAEGYQPTRISTTAIESYIERFDITGATSYSYQENGHFFYVINIVGADSSLVYDITEREWHERARWNPASGLYERDRANFHMYVFGKHLVSDYEDGSLYEQSLSFNDDGEFLIKRTRTLPYFTSDLEFLYFSFFQIDMQTGVGLSTDANIANTDPQISLSWSDDGGHTWSTELKTPLGKIGEYNTRAIWRRLGRSRSRVWSVAIVANVQVHLIAAHQKASKGYA